MMLVMVGENDALFQELSPAELLGPLNDVQERYAPKRLFIAGRRDVIDAGPRVAVIGSRRAGPEGLGNARRLATFLAGQGVTVVSGLAEGIDTAAHEAAIQAGGRTIAVLGTPLDRVYPRRNQGLQDAIIREHLAVSQFPLGSPVLPRNFVMRNRTMALVSHASIIVEAGESSGSLNQGWETLRLGRPLFIMDAVASDPSLEWPRKMMDYGAMALEAQSAECVLDFLPAAEAMRLMEVAR